MPEKEGMYYPTAPSSILIHRDDVSLRIIEMIEDLSRFVSDRSLGLKSDSFKNFYNKFVEVYHETRDFIKKDRNKYDDFFKKRSLRNTIKNILEWDEFYIRKKKEGEWKGFSLPLEEDDRKEMIGLLRDTSPSSTIEICKDYITQLKNDKIRDLRIWSLKKGYEWTRSV